MSNRPDLPFGRRTKSADMALIQSRLYTKAEDWALRLFLATLSLVRQFASVWAVGSRWAGRGTDRDQTIVWFAVCGPQDAQ